MLIESCWAITPAKFDELATFYASRLAGEPINIAAIEARIGKPLNNTPRLTQNVGNVAVIPVEGILMPHGSVLGQVSGATSPQQIGVQFDQAIDDPNVSAVVLAVNSPGGAVAGIQQLSDQIFAARGTKPIVAVGDGIICSAAYWLASACDQVFTADATTLAGSIGVLSQHTDQSGANAQRGLKVTEIAAGKFKVAASPHKPLNADGAAVMQSQVDAMYQTFVSQVARNRGVSPDTVLSKMADGRTFVGADAVASGLVDGIATLDSTIARLAQETASAQHRAAPLAKSTPLVKLGAGDIAARARVYVAEQAKLGRRVSAAEAVSHISDQL